MSYINNENKNRALLEEELNIDYNNLDYYDIYNIKNNSKVIYSLQSFLEEPNEDKSIDTKDTSDDNKKEEKEKEKEKEEEKDSDDPVWVRQELNTALIIFLTIINIIFILFLIGNWLYFEHLKYEKEDNEESETNNEENKSQNESRSININVAENKSSNEEHSFSILETIEKLIFSDIQALLWNLIIGIIAIFSVNFHFLYSVQLFTMYFLIKTMYTFIYSVQIRYNQFLAAGFLILIVSLFFAMIKYKWFTGPDECVTYSECFLDMLNSGIRGGSGMGFGIKKLGQEGYLIEFFLEWILFFVSFSSSFIQT